MELLATRQKKMGMHAHSGHRGMMNDGQLVKHANGLMVLPHQAYSKEQARCMKTFVAETVFNDIFGSGNSKLDFDIQPEAIILPESWILELTLQTNTGSVRCGSLARCIDYIQANPNKSGNYMFKWYGDNLHDAIQLLIDNDTLDLLAPETGINGDCIDNITITTTAKKFQIPILGTPLDKYYEFSSAFTKELRLEIYFNNRCVREFVDSATSVNLVAAQLKCFYHNPSMERLPALRGAVNRGLTTHGHDIDTHREVTNFTAGNQNEVRMSGIIGHHGWIIAFIRASGSTASSPHIGADHTYFKWSSFELLESGGKNITGGNIIFFQEHKQLWARMFPNGAKYFRNHFPIGLFFTEDAGHDLETGQRSGAHYFTGDERLRIYMPSAGTTGVLRWDFTGAITANGGGVSIRWKCPLSGREAWIFADYNISGTDLVRLLRDCDAWDKRGTVALTANVDATAPFDGGNTTLTFTFGGAYNNTPITSANFSIISALDTSGTHNPLTLAPFGSGSTLGVEGFTSQSIEVLFYGYQELTIKNMKKGMNLIENVPYKG